MKDRMNTFYVLITTQMLSMVGSGMTSFAIALWVYSETGNTTPLFLVAFFFWMPRMFLGSIAGVFADRLNRRQLIIFGDAGQALPTLTLIILFATGNFEIWHLYASAFVQALFSLVQGPALYASIPMLVPEEKRPRANAIIEISGPTANLLAPTLAGALYAFIGVTGVLMVDLATFLLAAVVLSFFDIPQPKQSQESEATRGSLWQELKGSWTFLLSLRGFFYLSLYFMFLNFITAGIWRVIPAYLLAITEQETTVGILMSVSSFGLVTGGLITLVWSGTTPKIHTILPSLLLAGIGLMIFAMVRTPLAIGLVLFVMMLPYKMSNALLSTIRQSKIPADMQGRVSGLLGQISIFAQPIMLLISGPIIDDIFEASVGSDNWSIVAPLVGTQSGSGMALYILICGAILAIISGITYAMPVVRHIEQDLPDYKAIAEHEVIDEEELMLVQSPSTT